MQRWRRSVAKQQTVRTKVLTNGRRKSRYDVRTRRTGIGTPVIAIIAVIVIVVGAIGVISLTSQSNTSTSSIISPATTNATSTNSAVLPHATPAPLLGELSGKDVSCSLASGVCTLTIVNNSTTPLELETCDVQGIASVNLTTTTYTASTELTTTTYIAFGNGSTSTVTSAPSSFIASASTVTETVTEYLNVNGTVGGPATAGIPANSQVTATCTVPTTQFASQAEGSVFSGGFHVKLVDSAESYPAGTEAGFGFEGTWSH
jgi:hypothetical protein